MADSAATISSSPALIMNSSHKNTYKPLFYTLNDNVATDFRANFIVFFIVFFQSFDMNLAIGSIQGLARCQKEV
jgi:hypothetical protein